MAEDLLTNLQVQVRSLWQQKGGRLSRADLEDLRRSAVAQLSNYFNQEQIWGGDGDNRASQLCLVFLLSCFEQELRAAIVRSAEQPVQYRLVDVLGRWTSCRALNDELATARTADELKLTSAALNRGLLSVYSSLLVESERATIASGQDLFGWGVGVLSKELCTEPSDEALLLPNV